MAIIGAIRMIIFIYINKALPKMIVSNFKTNDNGYNTETHKMYINQHTQNDYIHACVEPNRILRDFGLKCILLINQDFKFCFQFKILKCLEGFGHFSKTINSKSAFIFQNKMLKTINIHLEVVL